MVMQCPCERCMQLSASKNSSWLMLPARTSSDIFQTSVPEPSSPPRYLPLSMGPPDTPIVGRSPDDAPISRSEEHTSELQSLMRISSAVFCLKKNNNTLKRQHP